MGDFRCPKCGGRYFGTDCEVVEVPARAVVIVGYRCHNDVDGGVDDRPTFGFRSYTPAKKKSCGWRGKASECGVS